MKKICLSKLPVVARSALTSMGIGCLTEVIEDVLTYKSGKLHDYEIAIPEGCTLPTSISPVREVDWVLVVQDITALKELEQLRTEWIATVSHIYGIRSPPSSSPAAC
jgi:hypothetical protein